MALPAEDVRSSRNSAVGLLPQPTGERVRAVEPGILFLRASVVLTRDDFDRLTKQASFVEDHLKPLLYRGDTLKPLELGLFVRDDYTPWLKQPGEQV